MMRSLIHKHLVMMFRILWWGESSYTAGEGGEATNPFITSALERRCAAGVAWSAMGLTAAMGSSPGRKQRLATSTRSPWLRRKSMPMIEKLTAASRKDHCRRVSPIVTVKARSPQQGMQRRQLQSRTVLTGYQKTRMAWWRMPNQCRPDNGGWTNCRWHRRGGRDVPPKWGPAP
jgi:hypothetical protein